MSQDPVIRHYRGATRQEVEQAYRADAAQALRRNYLPSSQDWSHDWQGFLLAVTYRHEDIGPVPDTAEWTAPPAAESEEPVAESPSDEAYTESAPYTDSAPYTESYTEPEPEPVAGQQPTMEPGEAAAPAARAEVVVEAEQPTETEAPFEAVTSTAASAVDEAADEPAELQAEPEPEPEPEPSVSVFVETTVEAAAETMGYSRSEAEYAAGLVASEYSAYNEAPAETAAGQEAPEPEPEPEPESLADEWQTVEGWPAKDLAPRTGSGDQPEATAEPATTAEPAQPVEVTESAASIEFAESVEFVATAEPAAFAQPDESVEVGGTSEVGEETGASEFAPAAEVAEETHASAVFEAAPADSETETAADDTTDLRHWKRTVQTLDLHCAGEPLRVIRSGFPEVPSLPVLERRRWVMEHADEVRQMVINEPRGHRDMYGAILLPPHSEYADMCVLFMHNEGYSTMCGHGVIAITTGLIEEGLLPGNEPVTTVRYEVPAGIVAANAVTTRLEDGSWAVQGVRFTNVPSYLAAQSLAVRPDGIELHGNAAQYGQLTVDLAFGGAYYGIVNAAELGLRVVPEQADALRRAGAAINDVLRRDHTPAHPTDADLSFVYGTIIVDYDPRTSPDGQAHDAHIRNATIFADAELDRSPCGSGTSAILAQLHARGRLKMGQELVNAGITGEHFLGRVEAETSLGPYPAVITSIAGTAFVTGYSTFVADGRDHLGEGFLLS